MLRLLRLIAHVFSGLLISYIRLHGTQSHDLTAAQRRIVQTWLRQSATIIGVDIQVRGVPAKSPVFVVANHVSWLDIPIISSVLPIAFLSKAEIRSWPLIGMLAAKAGTLFIQRGSKHGAAEAIDLMRKKLQAGHSVASFPEAKTTYGTRVHTFHPRLFAAAIATESFIQPVALRYPHVHGVNPVVPYVDDTNFVRHAFRIMCAKRTVAEVTLCKPVNSHNLARKQVAQLARDAITRVVVAG